ncbi:MAG: sigma-70 family RNA polymerase sigma factor [Chloroherpetonaceae bacterium]|nr:sigma-70 family RNA polymerase sigma factor [Chloroherpetonaceae bacterium]MDW8438442.1 sigma-70 family RNA polymerase sigma factor [Chloroherpetonaceae bacterium]
MAKKKGPSEAKPSPRKSPSAETNFIETPSRKRARDYDEEFDDAEQPFDETPEDDIEEPEELPEEIQQEIQQVEAEIAKEDKPNSREEDYRLIDDIRQGNALARDNAYKRLLDKYRGQIYNLILKIVHDAEEVEDLVQESFSKAFNSIGNFNKEYAFSTWLYRIATNSSIDFLRKRRIRTTSLDNPIKTKDDEYYLEVPDSRQEPARNVMQAQRDEIVRAAIAQLPDKYRVVIEMRHLQELTYEEIAKELRLPLGTVKAHIFRGRELLYKILRKLLSFY